MPTVNFVAANGKTWAVDAEIGSTVMETAKRHEIPGIVADCGGSMSCATCHIYIAGDWLDRIGRATGDEVDMLELAIEPGERSRLSCQVVVTDAFEGAVIEIPAAQF